MLIDISKDARVPQPSTFEYTARTAEYIEHLKEIIDDLRVAIDYAEAAEDDLAWADKCVKHEQPDQQAEHLRDAIKWVNISRKSVKKAADRAAQESRLAEDVWAVRLIELISNH